MLIAHAPAGYVLSRLIARRYFEDSQIVIWAGVFGSVCCDLDMIYRHFVDGGRGDHHNYWTHIPSYWLLAIPIIGLLWRKHKWLSRVLAVMLANVYLHLILDSHLEKIKWLYPYDDGFRGLFPDDIKRCVPSNSSISDVTVPFLGLELELKNWVCGMISHWTFYIELGIVAVALLSFVWFQLRPVKPSTSRQSSG